MFQGSLTITFSSNEKYTMLINDHTPGFDIHLDRSNKNTYTDYSFNGSLLTTTYVYIRQTLGKFSCTYIFKHDQIFAKKILLKFLRIRL